MSELANSIATFSQLFLKQEETNNLIKVRSRMLDVYIPQSLSPVPKADITNGSQHSFHLNPDLVSKILETQHSRQPPLLIRVVIWYVIYLSSLNQKTQNKTLVSIMTTY